MDSSSTPSANPSRSTHRLADILGTAIALLTLTLPLWVIGHYSPSNVSSVTTPISYPLQSPP
ncbi:MAG: hypothetical protein KME01_05775 [Chroococcus sp. CMT-3BRIN-NPC107]|nr:hypothetical protein [Chroococcus sp. CMT-3BRIN-NPC107]